MFHVGDSDSEEDEEIVQSKQPQNNNTGDFGFTDSEDEDSENRKVISPLEKFEMNLRSCLDQMMNLSDQFNWAGAYGQFQDLVKLVDKNKRLIRVRGAPEFYLIHMNRFIENLRVANKEELANYEGKNKSENAKLFKRMQNDLLKKRNIPWSKELDKFKSENDIWADEPEEEDDDDNEDGEVGDEEFGAEDWSEEWSNDSVDSDDDGAPDDGPSGVREKPDMYKREFWLKKEYQPAWMQKKESEKASNRAERQKRREEAKLKQSDDKGEGERKKEKVWNDKSVKRLIDTVLTSKGSVDRGDRRKFIESLKLADSKCQRTQWKMLIKLLLIENLLDLYTPPRCLKRGAWHDIIEYTTALIELLREHTGYRLHIRGLRKLELNEEEKAKLLEAEQAKAPSSALTTFGHGLADAENMLKKEQVVDDDTVEGLSEEFFWLKGNLHSICTRLSDDLIIAFKKSDIKNEEYEERKNDKELLVKLCVTCREYIRDVTGHRMEQLKFRHLFVKLTFEDYDKDWDAMAKPKKLYVPFELKPETQVLENVLEIFSETREFDLARPKGEPSGAKLFGAEDAQEDEYCMLRDKMKVESVLYLVHYLAIHHHFLIARDILAAWHRGKENDLNKAEISIQILYNRTLARLAIAAFTHEDWMTSMMLLQRLYITGKIKELLAQGVKSDLRWKHNKTPDEVAQEQQEKQRMVPQHTFIDNDLLESVHYVSSLFFEMKAILQSEASDETRVQNRSFRRQWEYRQKREFLAPPENTRDTILEAGAKMLKGNWKACLEHLRSLKCWEHFEYADKIKERVERRAKTECLRCYLMSSSKHFSDIELKVLSEKFEMPEKRVIKLCSQFIIEQDVKASIDLPGGYLIIHEPLPTQFETSAENFHHELTHFFQAIKDSADMLKVNVGSANKREKRRDNRQEGRSNKGGSWR